MTLADSRYQFGIFKHVFFRSFIDHIDSDSAQGNHCNDSSGLHMALTRGIKTTHGTKEQYQMGPQMLSGMRVHDECPGTRRCQEQVCGDGQHSCSSALLEATSSGEASLSHFYKQC